MVPSGPSWDNARRNIAQGSTMKVRVELTTSFIASKASVKCKYPSYCRKSKSVVVVADFLLDGSSQVSKVY